MRLDSRCIASFVRRGLFATAVAALVWAAPARHASAHAILLESDPADGTAMLDAPREVHLRLSERASQRFSSAQLLDADGRVIAGPEIRITRPETTSLALTLPSLPAGSYTLFWKVFSEDDGHFSKGYLVFGVGTEAGPVLAATPKLETRPDGAEVALRWLGFGLLAMLVGAIGVVGFVLNDRLTADPLVRDRLHEAQCRVLAWSACCGCLALLVGVGLLVAQSVALQEAQPDEASLWRLTWQVIGQTRWGTLWLLREISLAATIGILFLMCRKARGESHSPPEPDRIRRRGWRQPLWLAAAAFALLSVTAQALTGHAAGVGDRVWLAVAADALHLLGAGLWVGGIFALACGLLPLMRTDSIGCIALAREGWRPFSRLAVIAVGLLFSTGFYALGRQAASLDALITTLYGLSLFTKIGLALTMGVIGLLNAAILRPERVRSVLARAFGRPVVGWNMLSMARLPRLIRLDVGLALFVLLLTALITSSPPPRDAAFNIATEDVREQQTRFVDDLMVTLSVKPGRPGQNLLSAFVASTRRPPQAEIARVIARFAFQGRNLGRVSVVAEAIEPGRYVVGGRHLSVAGTWQIDVTVRRSGIADAVARFDWVVPPPGALGPTILSKYPMRPVTDAIAGIILLALVGAVATIFSRARGRGAIDEPQRRAPTHGAAANGSRSEVATGAAE